jgi:hypothetical protein
MSDRPLIAPNTITPIINGASMTTSVTGPATIIQRLPGISYDIVWTGTPTGTFQVQVSNTVVLGANGAVLTAGSWTTLPTSSFTGTYPVPSGSAGNGMLDVVGTECYAIRLTYTASSGSGLLTVVAAAKVW